jgi:hypothetical protein
MDVFADPATSHSKFKIDRDTGKFFFAFSLPKTTDQINKLTITLQ